jgi:hypothetical protein
MMIELIEVAKSESVIDNFGEKKFAHYAEKTAVTEGYVLGTPVIALCGKLFVPSRDPEKFPICVECRDILDSLFLDSE